MEFVVSCQFLVVSYQFLVFSCQLLVLVVSSFCLQEAQQGLAKQLSLQVVAVAGEMNAVAAHVAGSKPATRCSGTTAHAIEVPHCHMVSLAIAQNHVAHLGNSALDYMAAAAVLLGFERGG